MKLDTIDLFAGGGGLSLGFQNAGYNLMAAFDNWEPAFTIYNANFSDHPIFNDDLSSQDVIKKIREYNPEIIVGGPPCQDFSSAGKRDETQGRANLTVVFAEIVTSIKPTFFVMENVERAAKSRAVNIAKSIFHDSNYGLTSIVLNASYCGVPQKRKRFFLIGHYGYQDDFLESSLKMNLSKKPLTLREYFGDRLGIEHYYRHPRSYKRRGVFSIDEPSPTIRGVNRPIPKGYPGHHGDTRDINDNVRPLTTKERSMIQTFPEEFILKGSKTDLEQIIGNAVPIKLAEYVARILKGYIEKKLVDQSLIRQRINDFTHLTEKIDPIIN